MLDPRPPARTSLAPRRCVSPSWPRAPAVSLAHVVHVAHRGPRQHAVVGGHGGGGRGRRQSPGGSRRARLRAVGNCPRRKLRPDASGAWQRQPSALRGGGGFNLSGTVQSVTGDTLTITTANGQTVEFTLGSATTYSAKTPATASDVKAGSKVEVQLEFGDGGRPTASAAASPGPVGTASSVTVVP